MATSLLPISRRCTIKIIFPNKPVEVFSDKLSEFDKQPEKYIAQQKADGWRCMIIRNKAMDLIRTYKNGNIDWVRKGEYFFLSRRGHIKGGPTNLPVGSDIVEIIDNLNLPDNTMLDSEWMARRTIGELPESLLIFDVLWLNDEWMGQVACRDRLVKLAELVKKVDDRVRIPDSVDRNYTNFFEKQKSISWTEGIVLKESDSTIISDRNECPKNPSWIKIKWRSGSSGRETFNM